MKCALSKTRMKYMEIKGQLDATDGFLLQNLLFAQHVSGHHYAHHQGLKSIMQVVAACDTWCFGLQVVGLVWSCRLCIRKPDT